MRAKKVPLPDPSLCTWVSTLETPNARPAWTLHRAFARAVPFAWVPGPQFLAALLLRLGPPPICLLRVSPTPILIRFPPCAVWLAPGLGREQQVSRPGLGTRCTPHPSALPGPDSTLQDWKLNG